jgi:hypothetical protein
LILSVCGICDGRGGDGDGDGGDGDGRGGGDGGDGHNACDDGRRDDHLLLQRQVVSASSMIQP